MYVCLCKGITDSQIEAAVEAGADSFRAVREELGVSTCCGKCSRLAREIVRGTLCENDTEQLPAADTSLLFHPAAG